MSKQKHSILFGISAPDGRGIYHLTCTPAVLHVAPDDEIEFSAGGLAFSVVAKGKSPISDVYIQNNGQTDQGTATTTVLNVAGAYSFACAVLADDGKIYMDANCPMIPIDPGLR